MKKSRFTEEQIIGILKQAAAGAKAADLCRKHGITETTFLPLEGQVRRDGSQRGQASEAVRGENRRLKRIVADLTLDKQALQDVLFRKW